MNYAQALFSLRHDYAQTMAPPRFSLHAINAPFTDQSIFIIPTKITSNSSP